jgi:hypothetical protein
MSTHSIRTRSVLSTAHHGERLKVVRLPAPRRRNRVLAWLFPSGDWRQRFIILAIAMFLLHVGTGTVLVWRAIVETVSR